jgi:hypothetical protein
LWAFTPFRYPFIDLIYVGAEVECWGKGIDVYVASPCDPLGRLYDYAPLWLRMPFLIVTETWPNVSGLTMDSLFMLSLAALPRVRDPADTRTVLFCVISPITLYALERGNVDVAIFAMTMLAVTCLDRGPATRLIGYAVILAASLLKFYPFVLFALLLRERARTGAIIGIAAAAAMGASLWPWRGELAAMAANIPHPSILNTSFGAGQLPEGLGMRLAGVSGQAGPSCRSRTVFTIVYGALATGCCLAVWRLARRPGIRGALRHLTERERLCILAGALLVCGCFFAGRSVGYREVVILPALPGLLTLARVDRPAAGVFRLASGLAVFLLWFPVPQRLIYGLHGVIPGAAGILQAFAFWLCGELCWWTFVTILLTVLVRFCLEPRAGLGRTAET